MSVGSGEVGVRSRLGAVCMERSTRLGAACTLPAGHSGYHSAPGTWHEVDGATVRYAHRWLDPEQEAIVAATRR